MARIQIIIEVDEGDPSYDPDHEMGITNEAYDRLTVGTEEWDPALMWLGEVQEVSKIA
jgi:hypothetical protein